ncbi:hypothetical protein B0O80DRAFT_259121 [Mortierella sp. GBAus27b]|nr:hypothetical protein B0O80DRAFT_259121 [Mortierella sp. GBAus27b]
MNSGDSGAQVQDGNSEPSSSERSFEVNGGRVMINIRSMVQAELVSHVLASTKSSSGLDIDFRVDLMFGWTGSSSDRIQRHDSILDIMRHPSTRSFIIAGAPSDLIPHSSLLSRDDDFSHLKRLDIDVSALKLDIPGVKALLARMTNLTHLSMIDSRFKGPQSSDARHAIEPLEEPLDTKSDCMVIHVESSELMESAYEVLNKIKSAYEIDIGLHWYTTQSDYARLLDTLAQEMSVH